MSTALDAHANVDIGEGIFASNEDGLVNFESQDLRLNEVNGRPIDTNQAFAFTRMRDRSRSLEENVVCTQLGRYRYSAPSFSQKSVRPWLETPFFSKSTGSAYIRNRIS